MDAKGPQEAPPRDVASEKRRENEEFGCQGPVGSCRRRRCRTRVVVRAVGHCNAAGRAAERAAAAIHSGGSHARKVCSATVSDPARVTVVDPTRRRTRLACRMRPVRHVDGRAFRYASTPARPCRPVAHHGALCAGLRCAGSCAWRDGDTASHAAVGRRPVCAAAGARCEGLPRATARRRKVRVIYIMTLMTVRGDDLRRGSVMLSSVLADSLEWLLRCTPHQRRST